MARTVGSEILELKLFPMNWLNILKEMSGNGLSSGKAATGGRILTMIIDILNRSGKQFRIETIFIKT